MVAACFGPESSSAGEAGELHDWLGTGQFLVTFRGSQVQSPTYWWSGKLKLARGSGQDPQTPGDGRMAWTQCGCILRLHPCHPNVSTRSPWKVAGRPAHVGSVRRDLVFACYFLMNTPL